MLNDDYEREHFDDEADSYAELDFNESPYYFDDSMLSDPDFSDLEIDEYGATEPPELVLDVPFVPSEEAVINIMLDMAEVTGKDFLVDLGCGDGRIVVNAALTRSARGLGVDLDPARIADAMELAASSYVEHLVDFVECDLRDADISQATVVTLYLLDHMNMEIKPKLLSQLAPGTRIVSNAFSMGDWEPVKHARHGHSNIFMWIVPPRS